MSGFGAPARTETPSPASTNGVTVPATTLPFLTRSSNGSGLAVSRSPGAGELSLRSSAAPASWITATLCPLAYPRRRALVGQDDKLGCRRTLRQPEHHAGRSDSRAQSHGKYHGRPPVWFAPPCRSRSRSASLGRLHMALLQQRDRLRRGHELDHLA